MSKCRGDLMCSAFIAAWEVCRAILAGKPRIPKSLEESAQKVLAQPARGQPSKRDLSSLKEESLSVFKSINMMNNYDESQRLKVLCIHNNLDLTRQVRLLEPRPRRRLGCGANGLREIKAWDGNRMKSYEISTGTQLLQRERQRRALLCGATKLLPLSLTPSKRI